jgi:hypothetical protein
MSADIGELLGRAGEEGAGMKTAGYRVAGIPYKGRNGVTLDHAGPCAGMVRC